MGKLIDTIKKQKKARAEQEKKQNTTTLTPKLPSISEVRAKNNDKYGFSAARTEKSLGVQSTEELGLIDKIKREKAGAIVDRLNTWYKNSNNFMSNHQTRFSGLTGTYNDPYDSGTSDWLATVTEQKSRFDAEADSILSYLSANRDLFDEEWLNAAVTNLDLTRKQQDAILKDTEGYNKYWSQWETEDAYKRYQKIASISDMSSEQIKPYLTSDNPVAYTDDNGKEITWDSLYKLKYYKEFTGKEDFANKSKSGYAAYEADIQSAAEREEAKKRDEKWYEKLGRYLGDVGPDTTLPNAGMIQTANDIRKDTSYMKPSDSWSQDQKDIYGYLYSTDKGAAAEYAMYANEANNKAINEEKIAAIEKWSTKNGFTGTLATLGSIALQPMSLVDSLGAMIEQGERGFVSTSATPLPGQVSGAIRSAISETLNQKTGTLNEKIHVIGGKGLGDVYQLGTSIADSMISAYTQGSVGTFMVFFGSASASGIYEAKERGATDEQAVTLGILNGLAEAAGEAFSVDKLLGLAGVDELKSFFGNVLMQAGIEASEEGVTTLLNNFADQLVMGDKSNFNVLVNYYKTEKKLSEEEAKRKAWADMANDLAYDMLSGAISGGVSAGLQTGIQTGIQGIQNIAQGKKYKDIAPELVSEAVEISPDSKFAQRMQTKTESGKELSNRQVGKLMRQNEAAMYKNDVQTIKTGAANRLAELGETGNIDLIASALSKQATGKKLSSKEQKVIESSTFGQRVANELNPENIKSRGYTSAWAENIGTDRINVKEYNKDLMESEDAPTRVTVGGKTAAAVVLKNAKGKTVKAEIQSVEADREKATFTLSNGETVASDKVAFKTEDAKLVADTATERVSRVEGFTNETATAMIKGYDGSVRAAKYITLFDEAYNMGATDKPSSALVKVMNLGISESVAHTAYVLGKESSKNAESILNSEAKNGIINNNINESEAGYESGENLHLRNSGERVGSQNTQGQISRVESGAGQAESGGENVRIADSEAARLLNEGREVKVADLGILGGSNEQTVRLVDKANETSSMKEARKNAEARGLKVRFFVGDNLVIKDGGGKWISARAYIKGEHVFIRADHPLYTADQLMRHELGHDMIAKGEVDIAAVRERLQKTVGKENIDEVARLYSDAYAGTGMSAEEIWEECICDSLGDMNIFAGAEAIGEFIDLALPEIKAAASETKAPTQTRGSPEGKASRTPLRGRSIEIETMENNRFDRLREFRDDLPNVWYARTYDYFYVYSNRSFTDYTIIKKIKITDANSQLINAIEGALKDEINGDTKTFNDWLKSFRSGKRSHSGNNANASGGRSAGTVDGMDGGARRSEAGNDPSDSNGNSRITGETESKYSSPEEAKASGKVSDAKFSIEFADDIANKQRKYAADGLSRISSEELEKAIADTAHMVNEMKPYANILPQDKVGKTLVKNGSYDVSVENTTVCIRTLAYNSFVDMVSEKVGRPLTQMESFLVSQKLYEIAKEPQCLYCYVSLDRKAFNEMVIRYTEQRDAAISAYEAAGKPEIPKKFNAEWSLFKEFLAGRKPTTNMWDRYTGWINAYNKGERLVSLSDISTEAKRLELVEGGGEIASQVKDILKYAQSASWAKKQTQYVAYYDEILKLKPAVIRNLNNHYGMRWYSFSDYSGAFIVENMQQITDAAIRGLKGLSYTKDTDFAEIFAPTGMNINISVYAKKTADGGYDIDAKQSANIDEAIKLREQYPNVGIVVVATDKAGVEWALAQEWSDVVIPFHTVRTGADVAEFYNWEIFNAEQNDTVSDQNLWDAYTRDVGKKKASKMVYPSEHQNNRETYLSICEQRGLTPRFKSFLENPNYMKLVNETRQSEGQTSPLKAKYNLEAAERSFDKFVEKGGYYEGWYNDGIDVDGEADIVAEDVRAGKRANEVGYGRQDINFEDVAKGRKTNREHGKASRELDTEYLSAVNRGDMETAQRMVDEAAKKAGYTIKAYHGSNADFTVFDKNRVGKGNDQYGAGFYFASNADVTELYGKKRYDTYLNIKKPVRLVSRPGDHGNPLYNARITQAQAYQILKRHPLMYDKENSPLGDFYDEYWSGGAKEWMIRDLAKKYDTIGALDGDVVLYRDYPNELHEAIRDVTGYDGVVVYFETEKMVDERNDYYYVAWFDNQMKSADPVVRDGNGDVIPLTERFDPENNDIRYSRELDFLDFMEQQTDREVLANAFESVAQNDVEKAKLKDYRENIGKLNAEEEKLMKLRAEIKELSFAKGARDISKIAELRTEAEKTANRIGIYDKRLLTLEASKPLRAVLEREKQKSYNRAKAEARADFDKYRARAQKSQEELKARYQESKRRGVEGRHKTEVRHKIQGIVSELNTLLLNPTAKKHIKEELRRGVAEALSAFNMDTVGAEERLAEINRKLQKETDPYEIERLLESYRRIQNQGANLQEKLEKLNTAYEKIKDSDDIELNLAYQEVIQNSIKSVSEKVGDTSIRDMTLEQLEMVYDLFKMIRHTIRDANKAFKTKKGETITQMADKVNHEVRTVGGQPYQRNFVNATLQRMGWTFLKPYVAFRTIGSETLVDRYRELREGEDTFYSDIREAQTFIEEQYEKYGFKSWDMKETREFKAKSGKSFELTLEQMMTLYAYSKREQAHAHIMEGGIVFEDALVVKKNKLGVPVKYEVTTKDAFNLSEEIFTDIANTLTDEQKAFVDAMQAYLSDNMGAKGNEVSMQLLGVKLFKEKFYLPIKSSQYYMNFKAEEAGEVKLRSPAFSKETVKHANNPIVLHNFTDLWAEHINDMAMYHAFVLALEDFTRVYNYKTRTDANVETMDTKATLETAYPGVTKYINKFLKDMNGGVRVETVGWAERMTSLAKKGSVLGSASVTIQQPSAIMRAMAYINPKYFVGEKVSEVKHKEKWEELKKYAPIAGIKEMGRFDVGMGQSTSDWIKADKNLLEKAEDFLSLPPAFMDEVTWLAIWDAVKRETAHNYPKLATGSDAFKTLAGERFTDVISLSQVYDSVFSRSDIMRNKSWIAKSLTAFMAEPTTTLNMLWDSAVQGKRTGNIAGTTVKTGGAVMAAIVFNSILKSFVMAMRDDEEDESYIEKYFEHFVGDLKDNLNPLNLIPFVKDVWSIYKGYDVERMDMALFSDFKAALDAFDSDNKTLYDKWSGLIGAASAFFGVPVKNLERDVRALFNTIFGKRENITFEGWLYAIEKGWTGEEKSDGQQLYEAMLEGDSKHIERIKARFEDQDAVDAAVYKALKENDIRIKEAAKARENGDIAGFTAIAKEIIAEGIFSQDNVVAAINSESRTFNSKIGELASFKLEGKDKEYKKTLKDLLEAYEGVYTREEIEKVIEVAMSKPQDSTDSGKIKSFYSVEDFYKAVRGNDLSTAYAAREDIIGAAVDNGKSRKAAESAFESSITTFVGDRYKEGLISDSDAKDMLTEFGGKTEDEASSRIRYWAFKAENPEYVHFSESDVNKYYDGYYKKVDGEYELTAKSAQSYGISLEIYSEYLREKEGLTLKEDIMYIINTLPLTKEQKDALYYLNGWAKSEIYKAPWR